MQRFRGGLVFEAHRLLHHSTLGLRVIKKRREERTEPPQASAQPNPHVRTHSGLVFEAHRLLYHSA